MAIHSDDTRACIRLLETRVHALNHVCINNADITKILGLHNVRNHVGRLTHALLKTKKDDVYKYSTLLLSENRAHDDIEENAYFARYYLGLVAKSVMQFVRDNPGCSQATLSRECLGLKPDDYYDHNWIASQMLDLLQAHKVLVKRHRNPKTCIRLTVDSIVGIANNVFRFGHATVCEYIQNKNINNRFEKQYVSHLLANAKAWGIYRLEVQKTLPGLVGIKGKPLRMDIYIEQDPPVKKCIEIDHHHSNTDHNARKLTYMEQNDIVLVRMDVFPGKEPNDTTPDG